MRRSYIKKPRKNKEERILSMGGPSLGAQLGTRIAVSSDEAEKSASAGAGS